VATIGIAIILLVLLGVTLVIPAHSQGDEISVKEWQVPSPKSAPHDIVVDSGRIVWFTEINPTKLAGSIQRLSSSQSLISPPHLPGHMASSPTATAASGSPNLEPPRLENLIPRLAKLRSFQHYTGLFSTYSHYRKGSCLVYRDCSIQDR